MSKSKRIGHSGHLRTQRLTDGWYGIFRGGDTFDKWIGPFGTSREAKRAAHSAWLADRLRWHR